MGYSQDYGYREEYLKEIVEMFDEEEVNKSRLKVFVDMLYYFGTAMNSLQSLVIPRLTFLIILAASIICTISILLCSFFSISSRYLSTWLNGFGPSTR